MTSLSLDLRQSLRSLRASPGFLVAAVLSLALGIGANLATVSVLKAALSPALAWKNPQELVFVGRKDARYPGDNRPVSHPRFRLWQEHQTALTPMAGYSARAGATLGGSLEPVSVSVCAVTGDFWSVMQVRPLLGRLPQGDEQGVFVASHRLWKSTLSGASLGRSYTVDNQALTLVGVLPAGAVWQGSDVFVPLELTERVRTSSNNFLNVVGRMRPGLRDGDIQAAFRAFSSQLQATLESEKTVTAVPRTMMEANYGRFRAGQKLLGWVSLFVTTLACMNLCTLVLGRCTARLQELGIRQALGARRAELFLPLFTDLLVAALPGLLAGWGFALATGRLLAGFLPADLQVFHGPAWSDIGVALGVALLLASVGAGLPALILPRMRVAGLLGGTRSSGAPVRQWSQKGLVALQVGLALTLLGSFGLVFRSLQLLKGAPIGIVPEGRILATVSLPFRSREEALTRVAEAQRALEQIRALPGVQAAGITDLLPVVSTDWSNGSVTVPGLTGRVFTHYRRATDNYFEAAGIPLVEGRTFQAADLVPDSRVVVVSQSFARDYFPDQNAVGRTVSPGDTPVTIVGIVGDTQMSDAQTDRSLRRTANAQTIYNPGAAGQVELVVKAPGSPRALLPEVRRVLRTQWPGMSLDRIRLLSDALEDGNAGEARRTGLMGLLAGLALLLTVTGIYGVLSRQVEGRRREMGIRLALGGLGSQVAALVVRQAMAVVGIGLLAGIAGAVAMGRVLQSQLFHVRPMDPLAHGPAILVLLASAFLACLIPALRAAKVEPAEVLRQE